MNLGHERISKLDGNTFFFKNRQRKCEYTPGTQSFIEVHNFMPRERALFCAMFAKKSKPLFKE